MYNIELALFMGQLADLLEIQGADAKTIRQYRRSVLIINRQEESLAKQYAKYQRITVASLEPEVRQNLEEIIALGHCAYYHEQRKDISDDLIKLLFLPGINAKIIGYLHRNLHLDDLDSIAAMAVERRLRCYPLIGVKTEQNLLRGIRLIQGVHKEVSLYLALPLAQRLLGILQYLPESQSLSTIGSVRRMNEIVHNIDLLVATRKRENIFDFFSRLAMVDKVIARDLTHISVRLQIGVVVNLYAIEPQNYLTALHYYTGTEEYKDKLFQIAEQSGLLMTKQGLYEHKKDKVEFEEEKDLFTHLNLPYIPPELQESKDILQAVDLGEFPDLIELADIKGDIHMHTKWSDGASSIEEMLDKARKKGYEYIAVTDHSKSLTRARGLDSDRLQRQSAEIENLNAVSADCHILRGTEADILKDGSLDFADDVLADLDIVGGSIHTYFRQDKKTMTDRITSALKNPYLTFLSHPTGRLLGRRHPYPLDFDQVINTAQRMGKFLEINSSPDRLDLNDEMANQAKKAGVPIVINTDAHQKDNMDYIYFGVTVGRKAWLEKGDVVNTLSLAELKEKIRKQRNRK